MASPRPDRLARPDDLLYRMEKPKQWDEEGILPAAFQDPYDDLSLYLRRVKTPLALLAGFSSVSWVKALCRSKRSVTPAQMYDSEFRVAAIWLREFTLEGYQIKLDNEGNHYDEEGHLEIVNGQQN